MNELIATMEESLVAADFCEDHNLPNAATVLRDILIFKDYSPLSSIDRDKLHIAELLAAVYLLYVDFPLAAAKIGGHANRIRRRFTR